MESLGKETGRWVWRKVKGNGVVEDGTSKNHEELDEGAARYFEKVGDK